MHEKIKVMITTEGTYPFNNGGVSTWCDLLIKNLNKDIDYVVYSVMINPYVTQKFDLPENAKLIRVPLWGTEEPSEHLTTPFSRIYRAEKATSEEVIREKFLPLLASLVEEIISYKKDPERLGEVLIELYRYFKVYEYKKSFKSVIAWDTYKELILKQAYDENSSFHNPGSYALINSFSWIYRFMTILNTPVPEVDLAHSAAAAFCGIPCILAKLEQNTPYILTEHGVYLREQYLSLSNRGYSTFLKTFLIRMIHSIVNLNYYFADQISPVCNYNTRWEQKFGVNKDKINVIYNGVDKSLVSTFDHRAAKDCPTVVCVARIDPVKDIITLIKAASIVKKAIMDVKFLVYGSVTIQEYYNECIKLKEELQLGENFIFMGHTTDVAKAYNSGDLVVLSSISEGFPYSLIEAMMVGKPIVATDVGGVKEALDNSGVVVKPRNPGKMADAIINLLRDNNLRLTLSEEAKERALNYFTVRKFNELYLKNYFKLIVGTSNVSENNPDPDELGETSRNQKLLVERGLALYEYGYYEEAIIHFKNAIKEDYESISVPVILSMIADAYNKLGNYEMSSEGLDKIKLLLNDIN